MLSLMRREGESIKLTCNNKEVNILIKNTNDGKLLELEIDSTINAYMKPFDTIPIEIGGEIAYIAVENIGSIQVSLGLDAPSNIKILRDELT